MKKNKKTVFVGMSGGVDSSVAALLLKNKGYNIVGVFMRCFNVDGCAERDAEDARRVAGNLGISFYVWDFEEEYKKKVVDYMVEGYRKGITPNPDIMCNKEIKFGLFLEKALKMGADYVATGHYVLKIKNYKLKIARDSAKDQSYFLWTLTQEQLKHCLFPIGDYLKSEVRQIAKKAGLITADKKDSQGICFLGKIALDDFLSHYISPKKGDILNVSGEKIGEHKGAHFYTIGQRHLKGVKYYVSSIKPRYVVDKNIKKNIIIVVTEKEDSSVLYKKEIKLTNVNLFSPLMLNAKYSIPIMARVRYRQSLIPAKLYKLRATNYQLIFNKPQKFIAPGQSAVFYSQKGELLGGGIIV